MTRPTGRPPKPTELKVLHGNPGRRPVGTPFRAEMPDGVPPPPAGLAKLGREYWVRYWTTGKAWLAMSDAPLIEMLCFAHEEAAAIKARIRREGLTHANEDTGRSFAHHLYNDLRGIRREIREMWSLAFMTPTDRARASVKTDERDDLDRWMEGSG